MKVHGDLIKKQMDKLGLQVKDLTKATSLSARTIHRATAGGPVSGRVLHQIAMRLGLRFDDLVQQTEISSADDSPPNLWSRTAVLIPAAGPVPDGVSLDFSVSAISLVCLAGKPILYWQMKYLTGIGLRRFIIALPENSAQTIKRLEIFIKTGFPEVQATFIEDDARRGPGCTVGRLLEIANGEPAVDSALVVLGDTYFQFSETIERERPGYSFVLWDTTADSHRWATMTKAHGRIEEFTEKRRPEVVAGRREINALIGVYFFRDLPIATETAAESAQTLERVELTHILNRLLQHHRVQDHKARLWADCHHTDLRIGSNSRLLEALGFRERSFHSMEVTDAGTIRKSIRVDAPDARIEQFLLQLDYLRLVPAELAVYFPRLVDFNAKWPLRDRESAWYEMEFYGAANLSDLFSFGSLPPEAWRLVFHRLKHIFNQFRKVERPFSQQILMDAYWQKTLDRVNEVLASCNPSHQKLISLFKSIRIGSQTGLLNYLDSIKPRVEKMVDRSGRFCILHGDVCLPNVLVTLPGGFVKLLDPRGSFGNAKGLYGDHRYDLAKLWHSVYGLYDCIVNDMFAIEVGGGEANLLLAEPIGYEAICERFEETFFGDDVQLKRDVSLVTALLFASMIPLHGDHPKRQIAMLLRAAQLFREWHGEAAPRARSAASGRR